MKTGLKLIALCSVLMLQAGAVQAQGIFVTKGEHGPVFSDKPQSGAKEVTLRPLTVMDSAKESKGVAVNAGNASNREKSDRPPSAQANIPYQSLTVLSPENESSVIINSGVIDLRVAADPSLQLGEGHAFAVSINGRDVGQRFTSTEFTIPPEFWGGNLPINQFAQVDLSIVDAQGRVLIRAASVRFFMRFTTVLNNPNQNHHFPVITPIVPAPSPKPTPEKALLPSISVGGAQ
jgi:hypothetical protein